jgi:hypothetical protein
MSFSDRLHLLCFSIDQQLKINVLESKFTLRQCKIYMDLTLIPGYVESVTSCSRFYVVGSSLSKLGLIPVTLFTNSLLFMVTVAFLLSFTCFQIHLEPSPAFDFLQLRRRTFTVILLEAYMSCSCPTDETAISGLGQSDRCKLRFLSMEFMTLKLRHFSSLN